MVGSTFPTCEIRNGQTANIFWNTQFILILFNQTKLFCFVTLTEKASVREGIRKARNPIEMGSPAAEVRN